MEPSLGKSNSPAPDKAGAQRGAADCLSAGTPCWLHKGNVLTPENMVARRNA